MGLLPLEFADCLTDSPFFREKLHEHEKELDRTSKSIKQLINDGKELLNAARTLSKAQKTFSHNLREFKFECTGNQQTDDEIIIAASLQEFGQLIEAIEDERDRMLSKATEQFLEPLEAFRKKQIGGAKDGKKRFDRQTAKFCQSLERYLNMKTKIQENVLQEADAALEMERKSFYQASMKYVHQLQEVQEKKKFEFVEILLGFMYSWLTFYHQGHEVAKDFKPYMTDLQSKLQKTRDSFESTREKAEQLMLKMLEVRGTLQTLTEMKPVDQTGTIKGFTRQGYLYLMEKKALGTTWTKQYCQYKKENKDFIIIPYNQLAGKSSPADKLSLTKCVRRASDSIEKRFCFDITVAERPTPLTFQALSEEDRRSWLDAMDGKEPVYRETATTSEDSLLDDIGFNFIKKCVQAVETRGLEEQGLYRVVGVNSKVNKLITMGLDKRKADKVVLEDVIDWETKTITSAIKSYLRNLPEPLMTFKLHDTLIAAAKRESKTLRIHDIHTLIHKLPESNFEMSELLIGHLRRISDRASENLMTVANLGVCFGPTLMRPQEETVAAIMDIKFCNIAVEILITNYQKIFKTMPEGADITETRVIPPKGERENVLVGAGRLAAAVTGVNSYQQHNPTYANQSAIQAGLAPGKLRNRPAEVQSSTSSSSDSLNSSKSVINQKVAKMQDRLSMSASASPHIDPGHRRSAPPPPTYCNVGPYTANPEKSVNMVKSRVKVLELDSSPQTRRESAIKPKRMELSANRMFNSSDPPAFGSVKKRPSLDSPSALTQSMTSSTPSMTGSVGSSLSSGSTNSKHRRTVRTLYSCDAENESELSFEPNQIISNVRISREPGWLEGTLAGKTGLIPQNYVEFIN